MNESSMTPLSWLAQLSLQEFPLLSLAESWPLQPLELLAGKLLLRKLLHEKYSVAATWNVLPCCMLHGSVAVIIADSLYFAIVQSMPLTACPQLSSHLIMEPHSKIINSLSCKCDCTSHNYGKYIVLLYLKVTACKFEEVLFDIGICDINLFVPLNIY